MFDLGAQYVGEKQLRIQALAAEVGVRVAPTPHTGRTWIEMDGRRGSYGGGLGVNMRFGHGNGAGRVEARIDSFDAIEDIFDDILAYSLRVGFDLYGGK